MSPLALPFAGPKEIQTRFLYPFYLARHKVKEASDALGAQTVKLKDGESIHVWRGPASRPKDGEEPLTPHDLYQEELLRHVAEFLFYNSNEKGCSYLRLSEKLSNRWFNNLVARMADYEPLAGAPKKTEMRLADDGQMALRVLPLEQVELFLFRHGVGVLSIALSPRSRTLEAHEALAFNYRLSQLRPQTALRLLIPHPSEEADRWARLSLEQQHRIAQPPAADAPLTERLGVVGGEWGLGELAEYLLEPLGALGRRPAQQQFSVYSVALFGDELDLNEPELRGRLAPFLSALTQIEEPAHAGTVEGRVGTANEILNRRHWAAVGGLGAAHIVADQPPPDDGFNSARVNRVMLKYFIPYLIALLQRTTLRGTNGEATRVALSTTALTDGNLTANNQLPKQYKQLVERLLEFAVDGYFTEVSHREALHSYYCLSQSGLRVRPLWDDTRRAISELDAKVTANHQTKVAHDMAHNISVMAHVQRMVEWIEIFLVSVYSAHLWHMYSSHAEYFKRHETEWLVPAGVIFFAALGAAVTLLLIKLYKSKHQVE